MSRYSAYIRNATALLEEYDGLEPLSIFLKKHFVVHKKFGSKDRKEISALCYQYFRLGHLTDNLSKEEGILAADFVIRGIHSDIIKNLKPEWAEKTNLDLWQRLHVTGLQWLPERHTPWLSELQKEISPSQFVHSHFTQPDLFVRIRPGKKSIVLESLRRAGVFFDLHQDDCLRLDNAIKIENILKINSDIVVQDFSSQQCGTLIKNYLKDLKGKFWDACAASGGKSIMMHDHFAGKLNMMASDIRPSILHNLKNRCADAGVALERVFVADLTKPLPEKSLMVDVALVDAPCTGSGTWSRTPEQHYFFNPQTIAGFAERQFLICKHVFEHLKTGGYIIYITCSVFQAENKQVAERLCAELPLKQLNDAIIDGTLEKADSMYLAIFQRSN